MPDESPAHCVLIGGGGHAAVLLDCLRAEGIAFPACVLVPERERWGSSLLGVPILGGDDLLADLRARGVCRFVVAVGGTRDNGPRARLFEEAIACGLLPLTVRHPSAVVSVHATIGDGCQLLPGAIVNARAKLGRNVIVNSGAIVEHDCVVGDHVHLASGAKLASTVSVGTAAHIGAGATVLQCRSIGDRAVVGAGAVVVKDVREATVVVGIPAVELRTRRS